jgi:hypothetical protein
LLSACSNGTELQNDRDTSEKQVVNSSNNSVLDSWISLTQLETTKTYYGDFNGDGRTDTLLVAPSQKIAEARLPAVIHTAWPYYGEQLTKQDLLQGARIAIVIAESFPDRQQFHIIYDPNSVSILTTQAAENMFVVHMKNKENPAWMDVKALSKGDLLIIPTEAGIDSYLFWDGTTYRSLEVTEIP